MDNRTKLNDIIRLAQQTLDSKYTDTGTVPRHLVNVRLFAELRSRGLAYIQDQFSKDHAYYTEYDSLVKLPRLRDTENATGILNAILRDTV